MLVFAVVGLAALQPIHVTGRAQDRASEPDQSPNYDTPPINIAPIADEIKRLARTIEAHQSDAKHSEVIKREERDLHAQEEMAKWARLMYFVTAVMTILTGVGVIFLGFTLYFTKQAAEHSASMVDAANKSVEEARKVTELAKASADISLQALIATDRAWVKIDAEPAASLIFDGDNIMTTLRFTFRNVGRSPALHVMPFASMHANIVQASARAREIAENRALAFNVSMLAGRSIFPNDWFHEEWLFEFPISEFNAQFDDEADEGSDRLACPGVLAGAMYQLPSDRTMRFTYMPFSIRRKDLNRVGWDGSISVDPRDSLVVDEQGLAGQIS